MKNYAKGFGAWLPEHRRKYAYVEVERLVSHARNIIEAEHQFVVQMIEESLRKPESYPTNFVNSYKKRVYELSLSLNAESPDAFEWLMLFKEAVLDVGGKHTNQPPFNALKTDIRNQFYEGLAYSEQLLRDFFPSELDS